MREIDLNAAAPQTMPVFTFCNYGDTRTGKTTFSGTFPRPLFLADVSEKGYEVLRAENWNDEATPLFESGVRPIVWGMETESDFAEAIEKAQPLVASGRIKTIVISSISFYADLILNSIVMRQSKTDMRRAYGDLGNHLRNVRVKAHSLGINVIWEALAMHPEEEEGKPTIPGRPMIPGQQADKFAAGCDFIFHHRAAQPQPTQPATFEIRTRRYSRYIAGNRLGARVSMLPDPFRGTYADFLTCLGYDVDAIRSSFVPIDKIPMFKTASKPASPPPVAAAKPVAVFRTPGTTNGKPATTGR